MSYTEKIKSTQEKINKATERIAKEQEKIKVWRKEITEYENLEVQGLLKTHNISILELKAFLAEKNKGVSMEVGEGYGSNTQE